MSKHFHDAEKIDDPDDLPVITESAYEGIEACRQSSEVNMFNFNGVQRWCFEHDYHAAVVWMDGDDEFDKSHYATAIRSGMFRVVPDDYDPDDTEEVDLGENECYEDLPGDVIEMMNESVNEGEEERHEERNTRVLGRNHQEVQ